MNCVKINVNSIIINIIDQLITRHTRETRLAVNVSLRVIVNAQFILERRLKNIQQDVHRSRYITQI